MSLPVGPSSSVPIIPLINRYGTEVKKLQNFLWGYESLSGTELIELVKVVPDLKELYACPFGIATDTTVEEHSLRALTAFEGHFPNDPSFRPLLRKIAMRKPQFMILLAFHCIGNGFVSRNAQLNPQTSRERAYEHTLNIIHTLTANKGSGIEYFPFINTLLFGRNTLEQLVEENDSSPEFLTNAAHTLCNGAAEHNCSMRDVMAIITLFYKLTAPHVSSEALQAKLPLLNGAVAQVKTSVYHGERDDISDEALQTLFKESIWDYSYDEMWTLERVLPQVKIFRWSDTELYTKLKKLVLDIRMAHLPMRVYEMWKTDTFTGSFTVSKMFEGAQSNKKASKKQVKTALQSFASEPMMQERLKLLSQMTFIHGTTSSTLAMMLLADDLSLICTGDLLAQNRAPMYGELNDGIGINGVNTMGSISTETLRDIQRIIGYTKLSPFDPDKFNITFNAYSRLCISDLKGLTKLHLALDRWREIDPEDYHAAMAPGSPTVSSMVEMLKQQNVKSETYLGDYLKQIHHLDLCMPQTPANYRYLHSRLVEYNAIISGFEALISALENGNLLAAPPVDPSELNLFDLENFVNLIRNPLKMLASEDRWNSMAVQMIQMKQWDKTLFDLHVLPRQKQWFEEIEQAREKVIAPLNGLLAMIDHQFTDDELTFIDHARTGVCSSRGICSTSEQVPSTLLAIISSVSDIPSEAFDYSNKDTLAQLPRQIQYYRMGQYSWNKLFNALFSAKFMGKDISEHRVIFENELRKIDKSYQFIAKALLDEPATVPIPQVESFRSLFTQPVPIIFSSTHVLPRPVQAVPNPSEFLVDGPLPLGKNGCDILFTDTSESAERIKTILPDHLKEEIKIHLFEELTVGDLPLTHSNTRIQQA